MQLLQSQSYLNLDASPTKIMPHQYNEGTGRSPTLIWMLLLHFAVLIKNCVKWSQSYLNLDASPTHRSDLTGGLSFRSQSYLNLDASPTGTCSGSQRMGILSQSYLNLDASPTLRSWPGVV